MSLQDQRSAPSSTARRLAGSAAIFALSAAVQGVGGFWTGSIGLVSDSLENLNDFIVNLLGLSSLLVANRREPCERFAYGWHRIEVFNTIVASGFLVILAVVVALEALHRFRSPVSITTGRVLVFSFVGFLLNVAATLVLRPRDRSTLDHDWNLKSAYFHAFYDALASLGLAIGMVIIRYTGWRWVDPCIALAIVVLILRGALGLLRDGLGILMHRAAFDPADAREQLLGLPGILGVEDLRSWKVCSHLVVATAHVLVDVDRLEETTRILVSIEGLMAEQFHVRHMTVHFETPKMALGHPHSFNHRHEVQEDHAGHTH